jgi:hypothetical protein
LNCGDGDEGLMYAYKLTPRTDPRLHWFGRQRVHAELISGPCPVCQGGNSEAWRLDNSGLKGLIGLGGRGASEIDLRRVVFRPFQQAAAQAAADLAAENPPRTSLFLFGPHGTGKTLILMGLIARWVRGARWAHYTTAEGLLRTLRSTYDASNSATFDRERDRYVRFAALAVDELHRVNWTPWAEETLFSIIDERVLRGRPTYCAANKRPEDMALASDTGKALVSRLSAGRLVAVVGEDLRPPAQMEVDL